MARPIDARVYDLYDAYCHSDMGRREFLRRASALGVAGGLSMAMALLPDYARACQVEFTDERITAEYVRFPSPGGNASDMRAYLVRPKGDGPFPAVLVAHENRGLNPYVEDVARRLGVAGFLALAPDALWAKGGYPGNDDAGRAMQGELDQDKLLVDMVNAARFARNHASSNKRLAAVGFCFGGYVCNHLAITLGEEIQCAVPFYGREVEGGDVKRIRARLVLQYAEKDDYVNKTMTAYQTELKKNGVLFEAHVYPGTQHGFHNDSTPRYDKAAAELAWKRTVDAFAATL